MPVTCAVSGCSNTYEKAKISGISFHLFPKDEYVRMQWIKFCCRNRPFNEKTWRICSLHFDEKDFKLAAGHEGLTYYKPKGRSLNSLAVPIYLKRKENNLVTNNCPPIHFVNLSPEVHIKEESPEQPHYQNERIHNNIDDGSGTGNNMVANGYPQIEFTSFAPQVLIQQESPKPPHYQDDRTHNNNEDESSTVLYLNNMIEELRQTVFRKNRQLRMMRKKINLLRSINKQKSSVKYSCKGCETLSRILKPTKVIKIRILKTVNEDKIITKTSYSDT